MTEMIKVAVLAVIQGITEFLPVSSSGHLVLAEYFMKLKEPDIFLEVALHFGTLISILVFYRKRIGELFMGVVRIQPFAWTYLWAVMIGSVPAAIAYALLDKRIEAAFENPVMVSMFLCVTGIILLSTLIRKESDRPLSIWTGIIVGISQAFALLPGISRSGSTITTARHLGIAPEKAAEFSLLLSLPALGGATLLKALKIHHHVWTISPWHMAIGVLVSAVVGYFAISILVRILSSGRFWIFGVYCLLAGSMCYFICR